MFTLLTMLPIYLYKDIENIRSHHSFIRKKILKFVIWSIDCEQSLFFFRFIDGSASPVSRHQSREWSIASLARFARRADARSLFAVKDQNLCGKIR